MARGRPKSDNPRRHAVQTFLTDQEYRSLERLKAWLDNRTGVDHSMAAAVRAGVVIAWTVATGEEQPSAQGG